MSIPVDGILREAHEEPGPLLPDGTLFSLADLLCRGRCTCDRCGRWQEYKALDEAEARRVLAADGWAYVNGQDLCPRCAAAPPPERR